jgi:hypothetical protein
MTLAALVHFAEALLWCALLFLSIAGYGAIVLRLFKLRYPSVALAATSGVGVVIFLGGCLNLVRALSPPVLVTLILLGALGTFLLRITIPRWKTLEETNSNPLTSSFSRDALLPLFFVALIFVVRLGASVHAGQYQASDDYNYYLGAPVKMSQLHYHAADPFSDRRILTSIGGSYFLQTLVLIALPIENVQMADRTLGLILLAFLAYSLGSSFRLTPLQRTVFAFLVLFTPQLQFNLTFVLLPSALFFGLVYLAANRKALEANGILLALLLGSAAGAVSTMKSIHLVHSVLFVVAIAFFDGRRRGLAAGAKTLLFAALGALLVMAPWMIANHSASGTYFYPTLGLGYHYDAYGIYPRASAGALPIVMHKVVPFCIPLLLLFLIEWFLTDRDDDQENAILALSAAAFAGTLLVGIATGGDSVRRYNYPCMLPAIILLYVVLCRRANASSKLRRWRLLQIGWVTITVVAALSIWGNRLSNEFMQIPWSYGLSFHETPIVPPEVKAEYAAMQRAIPTGSPVLATVNNSFLLDFRAHDIKVADFPGSAGLPPGWPSRDGETLARYLLANHLRYVVYDHAGFAGDEEVAPSALADPSRTLWFHTETAITLRSYHQFEELGRTRRHLYDDGKMFVLDLATSAETPTAHRSWKASNNLDGTPPVGYP